MAVATARPRRGAAYGRVLVAACATIVAVSLIPAGPASAPGSSPGAREATFYDPFDAAPLIDQDGRAFRFAALRDRVALVGFVYTGCSVVCPLQTRRLAEVQRALSDAERRHVQFVSVSIDPLADTPPVLKRFAERMGADLASWSFVTGRPGDIERAAEALRVLRVGRPSEFPADHATSLWLVDGAGRLMQRYAGGPPDVDRLVREIRALESMPIRVASGR